MVVVPPFCIRQRFHVIHSSSVAVELDAVFHCGSRERSESGGSFSDGEQYRFGVPKLYGRKRFILAYGQPSQRHSAAGTANWRGAWHSGSGHLYGPCDGNGFGGAGIAGNRHGLLHGGGTNLQHLWNHQRWRRKERERSLNVRHQYGRHHKCEFFGDIYVQ